MLLGKSIVVIMPAYNAEKTLKSTYDELPHDIVDHVILVDDCSKDETVNIAKNLNITVIQHESNKGYGGNQKTCYAAALEQKADIVVMVHPDYQYTPKLLRAMVSLIAEGVYDVVLGSRILGGGALKGGMPMYKYVSNRFLTFVENLFIDHKLSEYHTGYRAFCSKVFQDIPYQKNSNDFIFDNEFLVQCHANHFKIAEVTCPTKYFQEASSINFRRSLKYGFQCLWVGFKYFLHRKKIVHFKMFVSLNGNSSVT